MEKFRRLPENCLYKILSLIDDFKLVEVIIDACDKDNHFWFGLCHNLMDVKQSFIETKDYKAIYQWMLDVTRKTRGKIYLKEPITIKVNNPNALWKTLKFESKGGDHEEIIDRLEEFRDIDEFQDLKLDPELICYKEDEVYNDGDVILSTQDIDLKDGDTLLMSETIKLVNGGCWRNPTVIEKYPIHMWRDNLINTQAMAIHVYLINDELDQLRENIQIIDCDKTIDDVCPSNIFISYFCREGLRFNVVAIYVVANEKLIELIGLRTYEDAISYIYPYFFIHNQDDPREHFVGQLSLELSCWAVSFDPYREDNLVNYHGDPIEPHEVEPMRQYLLPKLQGINHDRTIFIGDREPIRSADYRNF